MSEPAPLHTHAFDADRAVDHLVRSDARMAELIEQIGPLDLSSRPVGSTLAVLARIIIYQQLSGKAAATIHGRFVDACGGEDCVTGKRLAEMHDDDLRAVGLSRGKLAALRSLCEHAASGQLPDVERMRRMSIEELRATLTPIRGIGPWSVDMLAIFWLGHADVFPLNDLGIRKGLQVLDRLDALPSPSEMQQRSVPWQPYRSLASRYLWRAADTLTM